MRMGRKMAATNFVYLLIFIVISTVNCQDPKIVRDIVPEVKKKGETAYLNCTVSKQQTNKVIWMQAMDGVSDNWISSNTDILIGNDVVNGKLKFEIISRAHGNDAVTYRLVINRLQGGDSGRYKCAVMLDGRPQSEWPCKYGQITVQVPPIITGSQTSNTLQSNEGSSVSLMCTATGTPTPIITWIRPDGKPLPDGRLSHRGRVLNITNIKRADAGIYRCLAENDITPSAQHDVLLVVSFAPETEAVQDTVGQAQNRLFYSILECKIRGMPEPSLTWYKVENTGPVILNYDEKHEIDQVLTNATSSFVKDFWFTLTILNVQANDYAVYYCEGSNALGTSRAEITLYETAECQGPDCPPHFSSPTITGSQTSNTLQSNEGSSVSFRCNATGYPTPRITWIRADGKHLPDGRVSHEGHVLNISNIKRADAGLYRCLAHNHIQPPAQHDATLVVNFKPETEAVKDAVGQEQNRRFHALLECGIKGMPEPSLTWYKVDDTGPVILNYDEKHEINQVLTNATSSFVKDFWFTLTILNVQANDYAVYYCEGSNEMGTSRAEITLYETSLCQGLDCPPVCSACVTVCNKRLLNSTHYNGLTANLNNIDVFIAFSLGSVFIKLIAPTLFGKHRYY